MKPARLHLHVAEDPGPQYLSAMFGCIRRIGCLIVLLAAAAAGYYWYTHKYVPRHSKPVIAMWQRITRADAERGRRAVETLRSTGTGQSFVNLTAPEAVAYLVQDLGKQLPPSAQNIETMIQGDTLRIRAVIPLKSLGADKALGPLGSLLGSSDTVEVSGTAEIIEAGLAQVRVHELRVRSFALPGAMIPRLVEHLRRSEPDGIAPNGIPLPLPPYIGDIRIANGKVTLYKRV